MRTFNFALPEQQRVRLSDLKRQSGLTYAEILRRAIDLYLSCNETHLISR